MSILNRVWITNNNDSSTLSLESNSLDILND